MDTLKSLGGDVHVYGDESEQSESEARRVAARDGLTYISPYNDPLIIVGQGTCGIEIARQAPIIFGDDHAPDVVVVSVGGGGYISGIALMLKARYPCIQVQSQHVYATPSTMFVPHTGVYRLLVYNPKPMIVCYNQCVVVQVMLQVNGVTMRH